MEKPKVFRVSFSLSVASCVVLVPIFSAIHNQWSLASNGELEMISPGVRLIFNIVLGCGIGCFVGLICSYICTVALEYHRLPIWVAVSFAFLSGLFVLLLSSRSLRIIHESYASVFSDNWQQLVTDFLRGFCVVLVPLFLLKRYFKL